jgi:hypothetical protein
MTKRPARRILDQAGQSTLEFALTLILLLSFVFFYLQITLVFAFGNYAHYATFMSARAYLAAGRDAADQEQRARDVLVMMLKKSIGESGTDRYPSIAKGFGPGDPRGFQVKPPDTYSESDPLLSWQQGVRYTFRSRLFLMPLAGKSSPNVNSLTLTSESWLGKEPSYEECVKELSRFGGAGGGKRVLFDNGC